MTVRLYCTIALTTACLLASCTYYRDVPVYGRRSLVSNADLRAASAAVLKVYPLSKIYAYHVASRDEISMYIFPDAPKGSYWTARRVNGEWKYHGGASILEHPIAY